MRFQLSRELVLIEPHLPREICVIVIIELSIKFTVCHARENSVYGEEHFAHRSPVLTESATKYRDGIAAVLHQ
jgi:hypothetical protein